MKSFDVTSDSNWCLRLVICVLGVGLLLQGLGTVIALAFSDEAAHRTHGLLNHDARHGWLHIVWGTALILVLVLGGRGRWLSWAALSFGIFYLMLCALGIAFDNPFGLVLGPGENGFHLIVGTASLTAWCVDRWQLGPTRWRLLRMRRDEVA